MFITWKSFYLYITFDLYNFFSAGGNKLQTTGVKMDESKIEAAKPAQTSLNAPIQEVKAEPSDPLSPQSALAALQSDVQPVGHDYVEEV